MPQRLELLRSGAPLDGQERVAAEPLLKRGLETRELVLGPEDPDTLQSLDNLAALLRDKGDSVGADALLREHCQIENASIRPPKHRARRAQADRILHELAAPA